MVTIYQADTYCDACGAAIAAELDASGYVPAIADDSDHYPQCGYPAEETDGPDHCGARAECVGDSVDLREYGLADDPSVLVGAESFCIGELLSSGLTEYGVGYLREMLDEDDPTPYQRALYAFWRAAFADELG